MTSGGNVGKYGSIGLFGAELYGIVFDLRWLVGLLVALCIADFWFGVRESKNRGLEFRRSRAIRRTANKLGDYFVYILIGFFVGGSILEPTGYGNQYIGALSGLLVACVAESDSVIEHILSLHGLKLSWKKLLVSIISLKWQQIGDALDNAIIDVDEQKSDSKE